MVSIATEKTYLLFLKARVQPWRYPTYEHFPEHSLPDSLVEFGTADRCLTWAGYSLFSITVSFRVSSSLVLLSVSFEDSSSFHNDWSNPGFPLPFFTIHILPGKWDQYLPVSSIDVYANSGMESGKEPA